MNSYEFTQMITLYANAIAKCCTTTEEIDLISAFLVQLGDTLATISVIESRTTSAREE